MAMLAATVACTLPLKSSAAESDVWTPGSGYRSAPLPKPAPSPAGFTRLEPSLTGVLFTNLLAQQRHLTNQILLNGSGLALADVDGDGWCDIYLCGLDSANRLFRNLGQWKFEDVTTQSGAGAEELMATGTAFADIDGDGDPDLIVNSVGQGTHLFFNDGRGHFRQVTPRAGMNPGRGGTSLALGDYDGDGYLDLYVANYRTSALMDMPQSYFEFATVNGRKTIARVDGRSVTEPDLVNRYYLNASGGVEEAGEPDAFYRNSGGTNYVRLSFTGGTFLDEQGATNRTEPLDWGLSVTMRDLNDDGLPDLFLCNDFDSPDRLWLNRGDGRFQAAPTLAMRHTSHFSMGADFADVNRDGFDDIFVLDMLMRDHTVRMDTQENRDPYMAMAGDFENRPGYMMNTLMLNRGDNTYAEIAQLAGLAASDWAWTAAFLDVDLDGWEDLLVSNGNERTARSLDMAATMKTKRTSQNLSRNEILALRKLYPRMDTPNAAFRNRGDLTFEDVSAGWGFDLKGVSHGMALADLDNDGDLDVVMNNLNDPVAVYRNNATNPRVAVRLKGRAPNTAGIGARIRVLGGPVEQSQQVMAGGRYLSADDTLKVFAAGTQPLRIEVRWRSGRQSRVDQAVANRLYEIEEPSDPPPSLPVRTAESGPTQMFFSDVSERIGYRHPETMFNDHDRQFLLPERLSQWGPGLTWFDLNGDGWEDLMIGSGRGGRMGVFTNAGHGTFKAQTAAPFQQAVTRDQTTILGWRNPAGQAVLLAGSANHEDGLELGSCLRVFDQTAGAIVDSFPGRAATTGPLAMADWDGDGDLDLFIGGRSLPGKYPQAPDSLLLKNEQGRWVQDKKNPLTGVGMVSGAVFSDVDLDGDPDLILACDWGPVRVYRNQAGLFQEATQALDLDRYRGWWNGVAAGDFDGDGRMDIVASNWGRNTPYESWRKSPLRMLHGDLDDNGTPNIVECHWEEAMHKWVPNHGLDFLAAELPLLRQIVTSNQAYGRMSIEEILGDMMKRATPLDVNWLESTVFLNRGDRFEAHPLPIQAQMSPAFGLCVGDLDGDGQEDLFLSQNIFALFAMTPRYDAGRSVWLRGNGQGDFHAVPGQESGFLIYGEQRGCALADFDADGRVDLAVGQNGAATKLYRNQKANPGLRVRLQGPPGNPQGIGAILRLEFAQGQGPAREVHAGSGFLSQDSAIQVLASTNAPTKLWVRWPGRSAQSWPIPTGATEMVVSTNAIVKVLP